MFLEVYIMRTHEDVEKELEQCESDILHMESMISNMKNWRDGLLEQRIRLLNELEQMEVEQ